jgi:hypothetical protein
MAPAGWAGRHGRRIAKEGFGIEVVIPRKIEASEKLEGSFEEFAKHQD